MRSLAILAVSLFVLAGCVDQPTLKAPTNSGGPGKVAFDNSTLHGRLMNSPHLNINSGMTLGWDFPNASKEKPALAATLIQFLDSYKSGHHALDGNFHVVAFIPVEAGRAVSACGPQDKPIKSYLRGRDTGNSNRFGSLVGEYEKGWYHAVLIAFEPGSFRISFDADKEVKPRTLPAPDPYVQPGGAIVAGGRELAHSVPAGEGPWLAWATTQVIGNNQDAGRTHKLEVSCQSSTLTRQPGSGGFNQNNVVSASAVGPSGGIEVKATYTPTLTVTASTSTQMNVGWVHLRAIPLETPGAPTA